MPPRTRPTAIVVDKTPSFRLSLRLALARIGVDVVAESANGLDALSLYETHRPDVLLLDVDLDGEDGVRAAARLLAHHPNAVVVVCSQRVLRREVLACKHAGVAHFLMKPVSAGRLQDIVASLLGAGRTRRAA